MRPLNYPIAGCIIAIFLTGCSLLPDRVDETISWSAQRLYEESRNRMYLGDYKEALEYLEKIQSRYPFGRFAQQSQLDTIYIRYIENEPESALIAAERFIKANPRHLNVDYAYYMKGLVNFRRNNTILEKLVPSDRTKTDISSTSQSYSNFAELISKFPNSKYAADAHQRMLLLSNSLATYELHIADYYLQRGAYVAAVNRAKYILEHHPSTPTCANALSILAQAYIKMHMLQLANDSLRVLSLNYPQFPSLPKLNAMVRAAS
jgi:outer membrane protein assembly factor BamD